MADERITELDEKAAFVDADWFVLVDEENTPDKTKWISGANLKAAMLAYLSGTIKATDVEVAELAAATYDDVQNIINFFAQRTLLSGGGISAHGDADGSVVIAACTAWSKVTDSDTAVGKFFDYAGKAKQTLTDLSHNLIYLDYNAGVPQIVVAIAPVTYGFQQDHILIGVVFRQGTAVHIFQSSNVGIQGINRAFMHAVEHEGAHRSSGLVTSDGGALSLSITAGVIYAGLNRQVTTVVGSTWSYWWTEDSGATWTEDTAQAALVQSYNDITAGKVALTANRYGVHWVYVDYEGSHLHIVYGQGDYTANQAEEAGVPSVLPPIVIGFGVLIAKIINQEGTNTLTIVYPWTTTLPSSYATDHNALANLTVGDPHTQYVKESEFTATSDVLVGTGAGTLAKKTPAELVAILQNYINKIVDPTDQDTLVEAEEDQVTMDVAGIEAFLLSVNGIQTLAKQSAAKAYLGTAQTIPTAHVTVFKMGAEVFDIQNEYDSTIITGTADGATAGVDLHDSGAVFVGGDVGKYIWNTRGGDADEGKHTTIAAVVSNTNVTLTADIGIDVAHTYAYGRCRFTAKEAGKYIASGVGRIDGLADGDQVIYIIRKNGSYIGGYIRNSIGAAGICSLGASDVIDIAANDYIDFVAYLSSAAVKTAPTGVYYNYLSIAKVG